MLLGAYYLVSEKAFHMVTYERYPEIFTAACILVVIGASYISKLAFGTSSIGALASGIILAQSSFVGRIQSHLMPFKGLLLGLFFMSIGMGLGQNLDLEVLPRVLTFAVIIVLLKSVIASMCFYLTGRSVLQSFYGGTIISQAGEFGFIIVIAAKEMGTFTSTASEFALATIAVSLVIPPVILPLLSPRLRRRIG